MQILSGELEGFQILDDGEIRNPLVQQLLRAFVHRHQHGLMLLVAQLLLEPLRLLLKGLPQGADLREGKLRRSRGFRTDKRLRQGGQVSELAGCVHVHRRVFRRKVPVFNG